MTIYPSENLEGYSAPHDALASDELEPSSKPGQGIPATLKNVLKPSDDPELAFSGFERRSHNITTMLSIELSAKIFLECLPVRPPLETFERGILSGFRPMLLKLGSICQSWRKLAWSTPQLWDTIIVDDLDREPFYPVTFIEDWLDRSGNRPLTISLTFHREWEDWDGDWDEHHEERLSDILAAICKHTKRWKVLNFRFPRRFMSTMKIDIASTPQLSCLILDGLFDDEDSDGSNPPFMDCSPTDSSPIAFSPSRLSLHNINYRNVKISFEQLTHFDTGDISPLDFIAILDISPHLSSMKCELTEVNSDDLLGRAVVAQHLRTLKVGYSNADVDVLKLLTLPSLEHLEYYKPILGSMKSLLLRSQCTLVRLLLDEPVMSSQELLELLDSTPDVRHLTIKLCTLNLVFFQRFWRPISASNDIPAFLPQLRTLHYITSEIPLLNVFEWSYLSAAICEAPGLESQPRHPITLIFQTLSGQTPEFSAQDLALLLRLVSNGIELRILDYKGTDIVSKGALLEEPTI